MKQRPLHSAHGNIHWVMIVGLFIIAVLLGVSMLWQKQEIESLKQQMAQRPTSTQPAPIPATTPAKSEWTKYTNLDFHFEIAKPTDGVAEVTSRGADYDVSEYGRIGTVSIWQIPQDPGFAPDVLIHVYSNKSKLEADYTSGGKLFGGSGLSKKDMVIGGKTFQIYYGDNYCDGVGCAVQPYVAAEVVGPTYSYLIEFFQNVVGTKSVNLNNAAFQEYLSSFKAN